MEKKVISVNTFFPNRTQSYKINVYQMRENISDDRVLVGSISTVCPDSLWQLV